MATALEQLKAKRAAEKSKQAETVLPPISGADREKALDELFSKAAVHTGTSPAQVKAYEQKSALAAAKTASSAPSAPSAPKKGVEIYSTFGAGSIVIDGKNRVLPVVLTDPIEIQRVRQEFQVDTPLSYLRSRRV